MVMDRAGGKLNPTIVGVAECMKSQFLNLSYACRLHDISYTVSWQSGKKYRNDQHQRPQGLVRVVRRNYAISRVNGYRQYDSNDAVTQ